MTTLREFHKKTSNIAKALYFTGVALLLSSMLITVAIIRDNDEEARYNPLGEYPPQQILNESMFPNGDTFIRIDDTVDIRGTKCNDSDETVNIEGEVYWQPIDPAGSSILVSRGTREAEPGCTTQEFRNNIPFEVSYVIREQHADGVERPIWRLTGIEWPIDEEGNRGISRRWISTNFVVLLEEENS